MRMRVAATAIAVALLVAACGEDPQGVAISDVVDTSSEEASAETSTSEGQNETDGTTAEATPVDAATDDSAPAQDAPVAEVGLALSTETGIALDSAVIERDGINMVVRFTMSSTRENSLVWTTELVSSGSTPSDFGFPTGVSVINPSTGAVQGVIRPDGAACVCSPLGAIRSDNPAEYFVTFDDPAVADFALYIPTFPLLSVQDNVVQPATDLSVVGLEPGSTSAEGMLLDAVALRRSGSLTLLEFQLSNPTDRSKTFTFEMIEGSLNSVDFGYPTGISLFDPASQAVVKVFRPENRPCTCSKLGTLRTGGSGQFFVFLDGVESSSVNITIPGFPVLTGVPVN